ncbi:MAG TPA: hypothetical protein PLX60_07195 [Chitinophagales bacterium]|nr:hypothetical protein [Chitinophagales bacterium]
MKSLIVKSIVIAVVLFLCGSLWQRIVDKGLKQSAEYGPVYSEWDSIYKGGIDADILIMGSSRAAILVNPEVISDSFNTTCYNIGIDGHKFLTQYYRYFIYEKYNKAPKTIILSLDIFTLIRTKDFFGYEQFIPYLDDTLIRNIVKPFDVFTWKDFYIPMVKFTHRKDMILDGTLASLRPSVIKNTKKRGFISIDKSWDTAFVRNALDLMYVDGFTAKIDSQTNNLFFSFIEYCKSKKIQLIMVYPPEYAGNLNLCTNRKYIMNYYNNIATSRKIPYYNYMDYPQIANDTALFFDSQHMNTKGVKLFNEKLVNDIKSDLQLTATSH